MKKLLLIVFMLFTFVTVNAAVGTNTSNIKIENVNVTVNEKIGYNEELKVKYSINPRDSKNLNLVWTVEGLKKGVTAEFVSGKITKESDGEVVIKVNNTLDKDVVLTLKATQNGKVLSTTKLNVETKNNTIERVQKEVEALVSGLDTKVGKNNYENTKAAVERVEELLKNNEEVKLNDEQKAKYEEVKTSVEKYNPENKALIIGVSVGLAVIFSLLLFWIFKKED